MAYVVDLNEEEDVPITCMRSKADCPNNEVLIFFLMIFNLLFITLFIQSNTSLTTNDIVINKLTQILSYLRHGKRDLKKKKKVIKSEENETRKIDPANNLNIYDDIGDYVPTITKTEATKKQDAIDTKRDYFGTARGHVFILKTIKLKLNQKLMKFNLQEEKDIQQGPSFEAAHEFIKNINDKYSKKEIEPKKDEKKSTGMSIKFDSDSYSECYPG